MATAKEVLRLFEHYNAFPVLQPGKPQEYIPYNIIAPHEAQAMRNHDQSLQRLAERGGLDWSEILAVLKDKTWKEMGYGLNDTGGIDARQAVMEHIKERSAPHGC